MSRVKFEDQLASEVDYANKAAKIVNDAINDAITQLEKQLAEEFGFSMNDPGVKECFPEIEENPATRSKTPLLADENEPIEKIPNIQWMTIDQFGRDLAESKLDEFIKQTWKYDGSWLYCIDYMGEKEEKYDMRYNFRVKWSIPTRRKPIPRATASVFFTFSVSKIKPGTYPVEVYYIFETNRLIHRPGQSVFREKWLKDIIESKVQLYNILDF